MMHPSNEILKHFELKYYNTVIERAAFERAFRQTKEKIIFTFQGYDGESRTARVYRTDLSGYEGFRFMKVGKALHMVEEDSSVLEKATGEYHKRVIWVIDVLRAER